MERGNRSLVTEFIFVGYPSKRKLQTLLFIFFLMIYILTILSNICIIFLVKTDRRLHSPMYLFLSNLSFVEIWYTTTTVPRMLMDLMREIKSISSTLCITQFYFFFSFGAQEDCFLTIMAFDRYLAICRPLHYHSIMTNKVCCLLIVASYLNGFLFPVLLVIWMSKLSFCTPNSLDHFICDFAPLLRLSCTDVSVIELTFSVLVRTVIFSCVLFLTASYSFIIRTILKIPSTTGRQKTFSTCAAHLASVSILYGTSMFIYVRPAASEMSFPFDKVVTIFYAIIIPLLNPIIYSLRNKEMKEAFQKAIEMWRTF